MFGVSNFLIRWLFLCNLIEDIAEIQTLPYTPPFSNPDHPPLHPHPPPPPPPPLSHQHASIEEGTSPIPQQQQSTTDGVSSSSSSPLVTEEEWKEQCIRGIISYPPGIQRLLVIDTMRVQLVHQLNHHLQTTDAILQSIKQPTTTTTTNSEPITTIPHSIQQIKRAYRTKRDIREYIPQLVSIVLKSPKLTYPGSTLLDPTLPNNNFQLHPLESLRNLVVTRCATDPSWGIVVCWLLEAEIGRTWKTVFEHYYETGKRLIIVIPDYEKASILAKIGHEKKEAFNLLQLLEQITAYGTSTTTMDDPTSTTTNTKFLPSSLSLKRCNHFGDTMHFIDKLTQISLDLRAVPNPQRESYLQDKLYEMNRRLRRKMISRGEITMDVEDNRNSYDWPHIEDLTMDMLKYSIHFPLIPSGGSWSSGRQQQPSITQSTIIGEEEDDEEEEEDSTMTPARILNNLRNSESVVHVLNIVVPETKILSSRERCPYLVHLEVAETGLEGNDARLYAGGGGMNHGLGITVEEAMKTCSHVKQNFNERGIPSYEIPQELFASSSFSGNEKNPKNQEPPSSSFSSSEEDEEEEEEEEEGQVKGIVRPTVDKNIPRSSSTNNNDDDDTVSTNTATTTATTDIDTDNNTGNVGSIPPREKETTRETTKTTTITTKATTFGMSRGGDSSGDAGPPPTIQNDNVIHNGDHDHNNENFGSSSYEDIYPHYGDGGHKYDMVRQHQYEQLHRQLQQQTTDRILPQTHHYYDHHNYQSSGYASHHHHHPSSLSHHPSIVEALTRSASIGTVGNDLLSEIYGKPWNEKCEEVRKSSPYGKVEGWRLASFIMKAGEDIRQEALVMQIICKLREWFESEIDEQHRPYLRPYTIMCVGGDAGLIECLTDAKSIDEVKKRCDNFVSLRDYFERAYYYCGPPSRGVGSTHLPFSPSRGGVISFEEAQDNFLRSLVGYSLVCFILQIKDRHNANILLDRFGHIMHIDFGFVLGDTPKMGKVPIFSERAPFKLSTEFWDILGGWNIDKGGLGVKFCKMFERAFACASAHAEEIAVLVQAAMLILSGNPRTARSRANSVRSRLRMRGPPESAEQKMFIMDLVNTALTSWGTSTYDWLQKNMNGYE